MKLNVMSNVTILDDAALVAEVLNGNRDAFGQLVARYQSAVCGLAYSGCGNISQSEDLAQETFIVAWRKLGELEEPAKFKSWLYGIARNLVANSSRKQTRNPLAASEPLDENLPASAPASNPTGHAIKKEEEAILWRSLEQIPETYREPLVLFYRENQSIERVAAILELSEEAARQRLSRGRKLLQERVIAFVEGALEQTAPGPLFALGVLAALPAMSFSAKAATFGAATKGGTLATGASLAGFFSKFLGPLFPFVGMWAAYRQMKKAGLPERALKSLKLFYIAIAVSVVLMIVLVSALVDHGAALVKASPVLFVVSSVGLILGYFLVIGLLAVRYVCVVKEAAAKELAAGNLNVAKQCGSVWEYRSRAEFLGLPLIHMRRGWRMDVPGMSSPSWKPVKAWIAISDSFAIGGLFAYGSLAIAPVSIGAISIGVVSYGAMVFGALAWGGFSFGVWAFGAFTFGWEAFSGGSAIAWHLAWGYEYAIAHDYALGAGTVHAAQSNTSYVKDMVYSTWGHDFATALIPYFYWLMWAWAIPIMVSMVANWFPIGKRR
jgi:RNA polymerase sigma factor (sigma-70 family)